MIGEDFSKLKEGDTVVVINSYGRQYHIATVDRVTSTQAIISNTKYRLKNGEEISSERWNRSSISLSQDLFLQARRQKAALLLSRDHPLTQNGVKDARAAADYAETVLREIGEWTDESEPT